MAVAPEPQTTAASSFWELEALGISWLRIVGWVVLMLRRTPFSGWLLSCSEGERIESFPPGLCQSTVRHGEARLK